MANIKKGARAYYADTDYRRDGTIEAYDKIDSMPSIPTPSAEDVGKVVKATENGGYTLAQDAGAKVLIVTLSSGFIANKTYNEILAALNRGDIVKAIDWTGRNYIYSGMTSGRICFAYLNGYPTTNETDVFTLAVDDTNTWNMFLDTITHLPNVSSADAGKFLGVDNRGAWELKDEKVVNIDASIDTANTKIDFGTVKASDIVSLINNGFMVRIVAKLATSVIWVFEFSEYSIHYYFRCISAEANDIKIIHFKIDSDVSTDSSYTIKYINYR